MLNTIEDHSVGIREPRRLCFAVSRWHVEVANGSGCNVHVGNLRVQCARISNGSTLSDLAYYYACVDNEYLKRPLLDRALEFDRVLQALHMACDIVPLRFHEPRTADQLNYWLASHAAELLKTCQRLQGKSQINVRWQLECPAVPPPTKDNASVSGAEYLRTRARATLLDRSLDTELLALTQHLQTSLPGCCLCPKHSKRSIPAAKLQLVGVDCLVERSMIAGAFGYLRTLLFSGRPPVLVSEELPPFTFVEEELNLAKIPSQVSGELQVQWCAKEMLLPTSFFS